MDIKKIKKKATEKLDWTPTNRVFSQAGEKEYRVEQMTKEERKKYDAWFIKHWEERYGKKFPMKRFGRAFFEEDDDFDED